MKEQRESFVFYRGFREAINALPEEYQLKTMKYLMDYAFDGTEPEENGVEKALFLSFKPQIDAAQKRYEAVVVNGQKGGRPKKENQEKSQNNQDLKNENLKKPNPNQSKSQNNQDLKNENQEKPNPNLNDNINVNDNVNINDNDNSPKGEVQKGENISPNPLVGEVQQAAQGEKKTKQELKEIRNSFVFPPALEKKVNEWLKYKKERRNSYQPTGLHRLLAQIQNECAKYGEQAVIDVIDMSISNNYEGILWAKVAEGKRGQNYGANYGSYGTDYTSYGTKEQPPQKQYGNVL